jgi:hypothetical protein
LLNSVLVDIKFTVGRWKNKDSDMRNEYFRINKYISKHFSYLLNEKYTNKLSKKFVSGKQACVFLLSTTTLLICVDYSSNLCWLWYKGGCVRLILCKIWNLNQIIKDTTHLSVIHVSKAPHTGEDYIRSHSEIKLDKIK